MQSIGMFGIVFMNGDNLSINTQATAPAIHGNTTKFANKPRKRPAIIFQLQTFQNIF
jgi:hypothetical protein